MQKAVLFEVKRKIVHVCFGGVLIVLAWILPQNIFRISMLALLIVGLLLSVLVKKCSLPLINAALNIFERKRERKAFPGKAPIMLVAGVLVSSFFVNNLLVIAGLLVVVVGDTLGHLLGVRFGRIRIPWDATKHVEGRIIGVLVTWVLLVGLWESIFIRVPYLTLLYGVLAGMLVESLPLRKMGLDDNLLIPIVTALVIYFCTPGLL